MAKRRIYYLARVRKTISPIFFIILMIQMPIIAWYRQYVAKTSVHCKLSVCRGGVFLWTLSISLSGLLMVGAMQMRNVF